MTFFFPPPFGHDAKRQPAPFTCHQRTDSRTQQVAQSSPHHCNPVTQPPDTSKKCFTENILRQPPQELFSFRVKYSNKITQEKSRTPLLAAKQEDSFQTSGLKIQPEVDFRSDEL